MIKYGTSDNSHSYIICFHCQFYISINICFDEFVLGVDEAVMYYIPVQSEVGQFVNLTVNICYKNGTDMEARGFDFRIVNVILQAIANDE